MIIFHLRLSFKMIDFALTLNCDSLNLTVRNQIDPVNCTYNRPDSVFEVNLILLICKRFLYKVTVVWASVES